MVNNEKQEFIPAKRDGYKATSENLRFVRITSVGCINEIDIPILKKAKHWEKNIFFVSEKKKQKANFVKVKFGETMFFADVVTGTLYLESTGLCLTSSNLFIQ